MRTGFAVYRIVFAAAVIAAIVGQLGLTISKATTDGRSVAGVVANFFSFFTIESNALTVLVFLVGAVLLIARKGDNSQRWTMFRAAVATYMITTGVVYNLLLRNVELPQGSAPLPWSNEILHVVAPIAVLIDWLFAPGRPALELWKTLRVVVIFPIVWVVYTLIRGPLVPNEISGAPYWYPYPFLDPQLSANGYLSVAFYVILIAVTVCVVAAGVVWVSRRKITASAR